MFSVMFVFAACGDRQRDNLIDAADSDISYFEDEDIENNNREDNNSVIEQEEDMDDSDEDVKKEETYWVSGSSVNFRKTPNTNGEIIGRLVKGTEIVKADENGDWLYIQHGESRGYIHKDYVSSYPPINSIEGEVSIKVKKAERLLELWKGDTLIGSFSIGLGRNPEGHKQREGDGRTPEGEYYVCVKNYNSSFYLSLGVSYPNKKDAAVALDDGKIDRTTYERIARAIDHGQCPDWYTSLGGEIMIHGHGGSRDWTAGCIAVDNEVMDILFEYCSVGTKITILP